MDKENSNYEKAKKETEKVLRNYPYWLIASEAPNLGYPTRWNIKEKSSTVFSNSIENQVINDIERQRKVNVVTEVMKRLDTKSHKIIEEWYFRDTYTREELLKELDMDKHKFYNYKNRALKKFMIALGYI